MTFEEIKSFFKNNQKSGLTKEIRKEFNKSNEIQALIKDGHTEKDLIYFFRNDITPKKHFCKICGKQVHIKDKITKGFRETCSAKCAQIAAQPKRETAMVEKHGVKFPIQDEKIREKIKLTNIKKFGVDNPLKSPEIQAKSKISLMESYQVENPQQSEIIRNKTDKTNIERYGFKSPLMNKNIKEKTDKTNLEKFGTTIPQQNESIKEKTKSTNIKKYGGTGFQSDEIRSKIELICELTYGNPVPQKSDEIKNKIKTTTEKRFGVPNALQIEKAKQNLIRTKLDQSFEKIEQLEFSKPNFKREDWKGHNKTNFYPWICNICGKHFISQFFKSEPKCPDCFRKTSKISSGENELYNFLKSIYDGEIIRNTRLIADGKELDIYLPEIKVAFEYNGKYFHTTAFRPDKNYHNKKFQICRDKGIKLIQIWDSEWLSKKSNDLKETIKKFLKNNLKFPESDEFIQDNMKPFFSENELNEHGYQYFGAIPINCEIIFEKFELYDAGKTIYRKVKNNGRNH